MYKFWGREAKSNKNVSKKRGGIKSENTQTSINTGMKPKDMICMSRQGNMVDIMRGEKLRIGGEGSGRGSAVSNEERRR
jgi:hypothetical protein